MGRPRAPTLLMLMTYRRASLPVKIIIIITTVNWFCLGGFLLLRSFCFFALVSQVVVFFFVRMSVSSFFALSLFSSSLVLFASQNNVLFCNRIGLTVFDGHGGEVCAQYCSAKLHRKFAETHDFQDKKYVSSGHVCCCFLRCRRFILKV